MKRTLLRLFAMSVALALQFGAAAQLPSFYATVPSGQSLRFEVTSPTTCCPRSNHGIVGERVIIPPTVSDGTHTYTVTAMGYSAIVGSTMGGNTKLVELPNTLDSMYSSSLEQFRQMEQLVIPASVSWMQGQAIYACNSLKRIAFLSTTPPATSHGWRQVFGYRQCVERIYVPAGATADYLAAFGGTVDFQNDFPNATFHEWGTATPTVGTRSDTLFSGMPYCLNGSLIISGGTYTDSAFYYTHDSLTTVTLTAVPYSFYADAPTGQRLYYRIIGTDSVEVVAPNDGDWNGYSMPAGSLTIPAAVTHGGTSYSVVRVGDYAFHICTDITSLTLSEGIAEVEAYAFEYCEAITYVSLPRSLRTIGDVAFGGMSRFMSPRNLTLASDTIWAETIAVSAFSENIISQPIVLPNVRTIGFAAFAYICRCPYIFVGDSCTSIGANAFDDALNDLGRISLGTSLQTVGNYALGQPATIRSVEFRGATVPSFGGGIFWRTQVDSIITPCGTSAAYRTALDAAPVNNQWNASATLFTERGCPVYVYLYDTLFYAMGPVTFAGRSITSPGEYRDTIHLPGYDSINILAVSEAHYSFYADAPTGQRLYYRIIGTDSVEVVAPNGRDWSGYLAPIDTLTIPAAVSHAGSSYRVISVDTSAFAYCPITVLNLQEGIEEVKTEAFLGCHSMRYISLPRSLRTIGDMAFMLLSNTMQQALLNDTLWAATIGEGAFNRRNLQVQGLVLPNVRTIGAQAFRDVDNLQYLYVGDSCITIGQYAFADALSNGRVSFGTSLNSVGEKALGQTSQHLQSVEFHRATPPGFGDDVFWNTQVDSIITPCGASSAYRTALYFSSPGRWDPSNTLFAERGCPPVIVHLYDTICAGGNYTFGGRFAFYMSAASHELSDTVHFLTYDSITLLHLEVEGTMASSLLDVWICETALPYTWDGETVTTSGTHNLDHRVYSPRGCLMRGGQLHLTVLARPHTYIHETVHSTAKGLDRVDSVTVTLPRRGNTGHCPDSLVTTYTHYDFDETIDTLRSSLVHSQCDGTYLFGGIERTASGSYADTVVVDAFHVTITTLDLTIRHSTTGTETADVCDTYTWQGTTYTASNNTDQVTLTNAAGCDSTVTLDLTVRHSTTGTETADVCDTYTWQGTTYTASNTTDQVTLTNAVGCDSTVTLNLTVRHSTTGTETADVCDTYTWQGTTYTSSNTTDQVTLTNAAGCDSTVTLNLTVRHSTTGTETADVCDTYTWQGTTYTASNNTDQVTLTNAAGCDSTVTLNLTVRHSTTGTETADVCDTYTWQGTTYTASNTTDQVTLTNAAGCDSTVTLALTVRHSTTGTETADVCDTYTWQGTTYTASNTTDQVTLTNAADCDSTVTLNLTVRHSTTGDTATVACDQFFWYGTAYTASATPTHVLTNAAGCDSTVTLALTINYSNTGDTAAVACDQFSWYGTDYTASATPTHLFTNAAGCDSTVTLALTINYSNTGDTSAVACDQYSWYGTDYTASGTPTHVLTNAAGCDSTVTLALTINYSNTGDTAAVAFDRFAWYGTTYTASGTPTHVLTNAAGCDSTVTLALTILEGYATDPTFGEQGIEVEAYGYCAGPGAVRYRLSSGQPDEYSLIFGHAAWTNLGWQRIATPGNIDITVPDGLPTGDYTATLYFRHSAYPDMVSAPIEVTIHVNLPETYVMPLFSDVIALVDTCHCLTDVQWYHREAGAADWEAIPGANDYYYHQEGGLTGEYFVSARYNGQPTYTCPQSDMTTLITEPQPTLTAYPNPTRDVVTIEVGGMRSEVGGEHVLRVLNLQGVELERRVFEGSTLQLDLSAYQRGSYVVSVDGMVVRVIRN